jgi:hypothetical protein
MRMPKYRETQTVRAIVRKTSRLCLLNLRMPAFSRRFFFFGGVLVMSGSIANLINYTILE